MTSETDQTESYAYDEVTPADDTFVMGDQVYIERMGEPPIPAGCGATCAEEIPEDLQLGTPVDRKT
jgi:hypothetical protein